MKIFVCPLHRTIKTTMKEVVAANSVWAIPKAKKCMWSTSRSSPSAWTSKEGSRWLMYLNYLKNIMDKWILTEKRPSTWRRAKSVKVSLHRMMESKWLLKNRKRKAWRPLTLLKRPFLFNKTVQILMKKLIESKLLSLSKAINWTIKIKKVQNNSQWTQCSTNTFHGSQTVRMRRCLAIWETTSPHLLLRILKIFQPLRSKKKSLLHSLTLSLMRLLPITT